MPMTYDDAVAYLDALVNYETRRDPKAMRQVQLSRMQRLCQLVGDPQRRFRSILVTGTNGKGSICAMLYEMLRQSELRAGLYTSPHVEHLRERIRVSIPGSGDAEGHGGDWITEAEFIDLLAELQPALEQMRYDSPKSPPTHFEALTALAFMQFDRRQIDLAVLEVGLGGRLDATNVVEQAVSILAPIDVDHADILGSHPSAIATEKAGVIKPRQIVLTAAQPDGVLGVLRAACGAQGVPLLVCGEDLTVGIQRHDLQGLQLSVTGLRGIYESLALPLIGRHQAQNAALAVAALEALSPTGIPHTIVDQGLARVELPWRIEVVNEAPLVLMDGAHNAHAARALAETLGELCPGRRIHLLIGMSSDKSVERVGASLGPLAVSATCTKSRHPRALEPTTLARRLAPFCSDVHVMADPDDAYTYLLNAVGPKDVMVVTGSLYLVGELRAALRRSHVRPKRAPSLELVG